MEIKSEKSIKEYLKTLSDDIIIKYYDDFNSQQLAELNIKASQADVICSHIREGFMPKRYNANYLETFLVDYEDFVVKSFQWYDLTWKAQKPLL